MASSMEQVETREAELEEMEKSLMQQEVELELAVTHMQEHRKPCSEKTAQILL